jgi:hypothetical protein
VAVVWRSVEKCERHQFEVQVFDYCIIDVS